MEGSVILAIAGSSVTMIRKIPFKSLDFEMGVFIIACCPSRDTTLLFDIASRISLKSPLAKFYRRWPEPLFPFSPTLRCDFVPSRSTSDQHEVRMLNASSRQAAIWHSFVIWKSLAEIPVRTSSPSKSSAGSFGTLLLVRGYYENGWNKLPAP